MTENQHSNPYEIAMRVLKLQKSRNRWRWVAVVAFVLFLMTVSALEAPKNRPAKFIAQVHVSGMITDTLHQQDVLERIRTNDNAKALLVYVDSPGGTMVGGVSLHRMLREISQSKPVVVVMGTVAASAGYMVAAAGDHVIANEGTLTGSVGVLMPLIDATGLAGKVGVRSDEIVSGDLKAVTSPLYDRTDADRAYLQDTVMQMQTVFLDLVKSQRDITPETVKLISDGRIITGTKAKELNLVDALGDRRTAKQWLADTHKIDVKTPIIEFDLVKKEGLLKELLQGVDSYFFGSQFMNHFMNRPPHHAIMAVQY